MNGSFDATGAQFVWDATSLSLADTCLRKYEYRMIDGWGSRHLSVHLRFGQHYATALEHFYKHLALGDDWDTALRKVVHEALIDTWDGRSDESPGQPWDSLDANKTRETLIRSIVWYTEQFHDDAATIVMIDGKPAVEHSFLLPVDNDILFSGHLDRLVEYSGNVMVMDQKTTKSTITSNYFDQFHPNHQMSMYTFAGKAVLTSDVKGVIIDAVQVAVGFSRYERGMTFRTDTQLNEWYDDTMNLIERARNAAHEKRFPMNPTSCNNYGGCEFRSVCARSPEVRAQFLKGSFDQGVAWDPSARR